jgi:chaperonin GroES
MKLKPLEDRVVVKAITEEQKTASGLVIPDTAKEKPTLGEVVAAGDGKWDESGEKRIPMDVKKGDKVIYGKYSGTEYKTSDGEELLILRASEILAVVKD